MADDADYMSGRTTTHVYASKEFLKTTGDTKRPARFIYRVLESGERESLVEIKGELLLRVTAGGREQVKALFYMDDRSIDHLLLQRFSTDSDTPHQKAYFALRGDEINKVEQVLRLIKVVPFVGPEKVRIDEAELDQFEHSDEAARSLARANPKLIIDIAQHDITEQDIVAIAYRRKIIDRFGRMLDDKVFFQSEKDRLAKSRDEDVWQALFEQNPWIFGYGLFYVFSSPLDDRKLEQIVSGTSVAGHGKRADGLLRTRGRISSLCFVEIKTPSTPLLEGPPYRPGAWAASRDLAGAIAQVHQTVQVAEKSIGTRLEPQDEHGNPTGEKAFLFRPRSVLVIGSLQEFVAQTGVNEARFSSFELLRRQLFSPEIMTFDELYERARFIVEMSEDSRESS